LHVNHFLKALPFCRKCYVIRWCPYPCEGMCLHSFDLLTEFLMVGYVIYINRKWIACRNYINFKSKVLYYRGDFSNIFYPRKFLQLFQIQVFLKPFFFFFFPSSHFLHAQLIFLMVVHWLSICAFFHYAYLQILRKCFVWLFE